MNLYWLVIEAVLSLVEVIILYLFCSRMLTLKSSLNKFHLFIGNLLIFLVNYGSTVVNLYSNWKVILSLVSIVLYTVILFQAPMYKKIIYSLLFSSQLLFSDILAIIIVSSSSNFIGWDMAILQQDINRVVLFCIGRIILVIIFTVLTHFRSDIEVELPLKYWMIFLTCFSIILIVIVILIDMGISIQDTDNKYFNYIAMGVVLTLLFLYISLYYLFYQLCSYFTKSKKMSMIEYQNEAIKNYIIQKEKTDKIIKVLSHDLKHILISLREYVENKDFDETLKIITEYEQVFDENRLIDVGNNIANAIINQKLLVAKQNGIRFEVRGAFLDHINISPIDLCAMIGNTLDNALEATMKILDNNLKKISVSIKNEGCFLFYEVENYFEVQPILHNKGFVSSKNPKENHGIGMISINNIVAKYDGSYENQFSDNIFKTFIMLRVYNLS